MTLHTCMKKMKQQKLKLFMKKIKKLFRFFLIFSTIMQPVTPQPSCNPAEISINQKQKELSMLYCKKQALLQNLFLEFEKLSQNNKQRKNELYRKSIVLLPDLMQPRNKKSTEKDEEKRKTAENLVFKTLCNNITQEQTELGTAFPKIQKLLQEIHNVDAEIQKLLTGCTK